MWKIRYFTLLWGNFYNLVCLVLFSSFSWNFVDTQIATKHLVLSADHNKVFSSHERTKYFLVPLRTKFSSFFSSLNAPTGSKLGSGTGTRTGTDPAGVKPLYVTNCHVLVLSRDKHDLRSLFTTQFELVWHNKDEMMKCAVTTGPHPTYQQLWRTVLSVFCRLLFSNFTRKTNKQQ